MRRLIRSKSVFVMLLAIFIVVMIPMYILGFGIYSWGYDMTRQEIVNSLNSTTSFYIHTLEAEIERIITLQYECLNDENLFYYVNAYTIMTQFQRINSLLALQHRLSVMNNSSQYIRDVNLYLPRSGKTISAEGGVSDLTDAWRPILAAESDTSAARITYVNGRLYLAAAYPIIPADPSATPLYILIIELSTEDIQDFLLSFNLYEDGGTLLMNTDQQYSLQSDASKGMAEYIGGDQETARSIHTGGEASISYAGERYLVVGASSEYLNMEMFSYIPESQVYQGIWRYQRLFVIFSAVALVVVIVFAYASYMLIKKPMKRLVSSLRKVKKGDLSTRIQHHGSDEFAYLYDSFNGMAEALQELFEMNYKQQLLTQRAELRQLQSQINPHFLHNSFFTLYRMAKDGDYENITVFLTYLSDYYRFITRNAHIDVKLQSEVSHAYNYARIQQVRFERRIAMTLEELPEDCADIMVPRLILQPVLENAFEHGLKDIAVDGRISVSFVREDDVLTISVINNGEPLPEEELADMNRRLQSTNDLEECTGIINIHRRLRLRFGPESGLKFSHGPQGGLRVDIILRFIQALPEKRSEADE